MTKKTKTKRYRAVYLRMDVRKRPASTAGMRLAHNHVLHDQHTPIGFNGFRAFCFDRDDSDYADFVPCSCGWRPELGEHYAMKDHAKAYDTPRKRANRYREFAANLPRWAGENEATV
jgi:hypothetical protein